MSADPPPEHAMAAAITGIDSAADEHSLRVAVENARIAIAAELRVRTPELALAAAWSETLRHAISTAARIVRDGARWSWHVSGSVARGEAAPDSDIETLLVLDDSISVKDTAAVLEQAAAVLAVLDRCGIVGDPNGVLASRGRFCRRSDDWSAGINRWCADPLQDRGVVMIGLLADSLAIGPSGTELRATAVKTAQRQYEARHYVLQDALAVRAGFPSRLRILATQSDAVDLKAAALDPVVKIARWAGLSAGSTALSTLDRLDAGAAARILDPEDASSLRDCFSWLLRFRWRHGHPDSVSLSELAPQDRAMLRSIAREVNGIRRKLDYLSSTSSFR